MKFVNLMPHAANLVTPDGAEFVIPPSGTVARCAVQSTHEVIDGVRFARTIYGEASGVPDPQPDTIFIVSMLVAQQLKRPDVVSPDTGADCIRNEKGQPIAVRGFCRFD